jgi:hypothetical protein
MSSTSDGPWEEVGISSHPLYVTYSQPSVSDGIFHSIIYYGCRNSKHSSSINVIVDNMYNNTFRPNGSVGKVPRKDSPTVDAMGYWRWPPNPQQLVEGCTQYSQDLLWFENGYCASWARFFEDMISTQGINGAETSIIDWNFPQNWLNLLTTDADAFTSGDDGMIKLQVPAPPDNFVNPKMFINNFQFSMHKFYTWDQEFFPLNNNLPIDITLNNGNVLTFAPRPGAPAMGNNNPMSTHINHAIVKFNNKYYDPSYGLPIQPNKIAYDDVAIAGFGLAGAYYDNVNNSLKSTLIYEYDLGGSVQMQPIMWLHKKNQLGILDSNIDP